MIHFTTTLGRQAGRQIGRQANSQASKQVGLSKQASKQTEISMYEQEAGGQADKQTNKYIEKKSNHQADRYQDNMSIRDQLSHAANYIGLLWEKSDSRP